MDAVFLIDALRQRHKPMLRRRITRPRQEGDILPGHGGDLDDMPAATLAHTRQHRDRGEEGRGQVAIHQAANGLRR